MSLSELHEKIDDLLPTRTLPSNITAEQALLGAILINNNLLYRVNEYLAPDHFFEPIHQKIYSNIIHIMEKGITASPITLKSFFDNDEGLKHFGGVAYLMKLVTFATSVIDVNDYARIIYNLAIKRTLIEIGEEIINDAYDSRNGFEASQHLEKAEAGLFNLALKGNLDKGFVHFTKAIEESIEKISKAKNNSGAVTGISTGYLDLDKLLSGFHNSDLVILAGRPAMGKTAVAVNFALNCCRDLLKKALDDGATGSKLPSVGFFSLEMSSEQLSTRLLSIITEINSSSVKSGTLDEEAYNIILQKAEELKQLPFFIDDTPALSISAIRSRARRLKRKHNLSILFVDYLQLIRGSAQSENRVLEVGEVTQGLKAIAKELDICVIALSQLSRAVEQREDKRPMLSDLRESGAIEQDADIVMFLYREEYYLKNKQPSEGSEKFLEWQEKYEKVRGITEVLVAKHRSGPVGNITLHYDTSCSKVSNFDKAHSHNPHITLNRPVDGNSFKSYIKKPQGA